MNGKGLGRIHGHGVRPEDRHPEILIRPFFFVFIGGRSLVDDWSLSATLFA